MWTLRGSGSSRCFAYCIECVCVRVFDFPAHVWVRCMFVQVVPLPSPHITSPSPHLSSPPHLSLLLTV